MSEQAKGWGAGGKHRRKGAQESPTRGGGCKEEKRQDPRGDSVGDMTALKTPGCRFNPPNPCKMVKES